MLTEPDENLLAAIYRLTSEVSHARTKEIAAGLGVTMPTVSEKIVQLAKQEYLDHCWRKGAALTEKGRLVALNVPRRHRLIETFLVDVLKYSIHEVNDEACRLEHAVSDRFTDAIDAFLRHPDFDPHGHPIPSKEGNMPSTNDTSFANALPGWTVLVKQVNDRHREQLHYLQDKGVVPGAMLTVLERAPFDGPFTVRTGRRKMVIAPDIARNIRIEKVE